ncbi:YkgJ family cysteine cluster protein [Geobacter sp. AOG2]|uniref:YkgJ family cysteine cluster protein n=1 Tax=Geobacter sp. AOG2 TaxID=1566347 RepID=UPI0035A72F52
MTCRVGCAACCIAPSISSPIPGMEHGKPAGMRCVQLTPDNRCGLFGLRERPPVCTSLRPSQDMCGQDDREAMELLSKMELLTLPDPQ